MLGAGGACWRTLERVGAPVACLCDVPRLLPSKAMGHGIEVRYLEWAQATRQFE